jgi:serine phosphatase RsbU (regulator of sigma subunit)
MLGISPALERVEHVTGLPAGSTLLLCTDGLVERRGESLTEGLQRLADALARHGDEPPEQLCDSVLAALLPAEPDDDVALLVLRPRA